MRFLPDERRAKALRYRREIDRKLSVVSYLLLTYALYKERELRAPKVAYTDKGKPYLPDHPDIHFNISHCPQGCVCAISDKPIGVDIQDIRPFSLAVARRCCSAAELHLLAHSFDPTSCFTRMWSMKESYLKMTGEGITANLPAIDTTGLCNTIPTIFTNNCYIAVSNTQFFREDLT